ncbi:hypothetical protein BWGOE8_09070 [Bacillus mycoides]|uniref:Uncharacterized protein n=2 Tax=Bacillus cereus group TaxID=86661 RepID=A0A2C1DYG8_BACCE|nr:MULTISPECIES: hypothetical protein [Bacillus cereus group]OFD83705.1 hypothetical protein BWGOE9_08910 [Bacillus mycoides]OFD84121.1 hypothetical protein BWGOE8_09070 [Bacillus mycoides]OFD86312.1 hypothetical protein BWGOE10_08990 [Bacillus mycoides]PGT04874.1 hypothetical protein COD09_06355 [Bacillus cereus]
MKLLPIGSVVKLEGVEPIAEGFAHGVSPNRFDTGKIFGFLKFLISLDLINGVIFFSRRE